MDLSAHSTEAGWAATRRLARSCALLAVVIAVAAALIAGLVHRGFTAEAMTAAIAAGAVCFLAAGLALVATQIGNWLHAPVQALLLGMLFRMGLPLAALVALPKMGGPFAGGGVTTTILGVYLVALTVETVLAGRLTSAQCESPVAKA